MPFCHKCGAEVKEENSFCDRCGASLKAGLPRPSTPPVFYRSEKSEKGEKQEKHEKDEKTEMGEKEEKYEGKEFGVLGPLIGGVILIIVGFMFYLVVTGALNLRSILPFFLIIIGAIVIVGVAIGAFMARGKNPRP